MKRTSSGACKLLVAVLGMSLTAAAVAQSYPVRPVRVIVPFSPGGAADTPGRVLLSKLSDALGQQVVVDNRPGAGSTIGAELVAKSAPDGYTLLMISNTHVISAALYKKLNYDVITDFTPVLQFGDGQVDQGSDRAGQGQTRPDRLRILGQR